jgi:uncharacterized protein (TIGR00266 family)
VINVKYEIHGSVMQVLDVELEAGESFYTESGGMCWMGEGINMDTGMKGGLFGGISRKLMGESLFLTTYTAEKKSKITFANEFVGKIIALDLKDGESIICQKDAFMCAQEGVKLEMHMQKKLGAGIFGGEGFILQKITGPGLAFFEISGETVERTLAEGEILKVDPGHIAMFEPGVDYDIERIKGVKNMLFGGEGLFLAKVRGPGKVWLQSMPIPSLAAHLMKYIIPKSR